MSSVKWPCSPWVLVAQWMERPPCVREVMGLIPVGDSDISLSHARSCWIIHLSRVFFSLKLRPRKDGIPLLPHSDYLETPLSSPRGRTLPRSKALSPLPPFVVRRKTLVAAGPNLGDKNISWAGGVVVFWLLLRETWWVSKPRAVAKNYPLYRVKSRILPMKNATLFMPSPK